MPVNSPAFERIASAEPTVEQLTTDAEKSHMRRMIFASTALLVNFPPNTPYVYNQTG
jgi:hypothetical protein